MDEKVRFTLDGCVVEAPAGATVLEAARAAGVDIPTICYDPRCAPNGLCRLCVVEAQGVRALQAACVTRVADRQVITTRSARVERSRRTTLELLASARDLSDAPEIQAHIADYGADPGRFPADAPPRPVIVDNPMYVRDYARCVLCWRCVQVCAEDAQYTFAINFEGRGFDTSIGTFYGKPMPETTCVFCGQCVGVCPTGALKPTRAWTLEQDGTVPV